MRVTAAGANGNTNGRIALWPAAQNRQPWRRLQIRALALAAFSFCRARQRRSDVFRNSFRQHALDIPAFDFFLQRLYDVGDFLQPRIDRERAAVDFQRLLVVADVLHDQP